MKRVSKPSQFGTNGKPRVGPRPNQQPAVPGLILSFRYAGQGVWYAVRTQRNFRIHLTISAIVILLGILLGLSTMEWAILSITIAFVLMTELFNTAIEAVIDLVQPDYHPLAKIAKDAAAGGVLIVATGAVVVGLFLFVPHLISLIGLR